MNQRDILIVDDEPAIGKYLSKALKADNYNVKSVDGGEDALNLLKKDKFDLVITDLRMPDITGLDLLKELKKDQNPAGVIVMSGYGTIEDAVESIKIGAFDFITKPFTMKKISELTKRYFQANSSSAESTYLTTDDHYAEMLGRSEQMKEVFATIEQIAATDVTVFIQGPTGTGKELVSNAIHSQSHLKDKPFIKVNCAALPAGLMESELFGHVRGAFTGAIKDRRGVFEMAHEGTLLLDEISEMDLGLQAKLLRVLQTGEFQKVGNEVTQTANVRVIATSNRKIEDEIQNGAFREDLYYRLNVVPLYLPALADRIEDIPVLSHFFVRRSASKYGKPELQISEGAIKTLMTLSFPGNVRELENRIERAVVLCRGDEIQANDLNLNSPVNIDDDPSKSENAPGTIEEAERQLIMKTLQMNEGNRTQTADALGITVRTLRNKLHKYKAEGQI